MSDKEKVKQQKPEEPTSQDGMKKEYGGSEKPDPVRYGDWEIGGKCVDF